MKTVTTRVLPLRWLLVGVIVALNVGDLLTTSLVLARGGTEANPLMKPFVDSLLTGFMVKALSLGLLAALLARVPSSSRSVDALLAGLCAWFAVIVAWNSLVFRSMG